MEIELDEMVQKHP